MTPEKTHPTEMPPSQGKPFPWRCPECGKKEVRPATLRHTSQIKHDGRLYVVEVPKLRVKETAFEPLLCKTPPSRLRKLLVGRPAPLFACKTPLVMVVEPLYVLAPERIVVPGPFCVTEPLLLITPLKVPVMPAAGTKVTGHAC